MELLQANRQLAVDGPAADITAGDVILDGIGALVNVDGVGSGQDIRERGIDRCVALLDRNRGSGAERFPCGRQGNVRQGVDDIAEIVTTPRVDMCRVRRIPVLLRSHHQLPSEINRTAMASRIEMTNGVPAAIQRRERSMAMNLLRDSR